MTRQIFISYAHKDAELCGKICNLLRQYHLVIWHDEDGLPPEAEDFNVEIENAIDESQFFICMWTRNIIQSDYCRKELERALALKDRDPENRSVFILKLDETLDDLMDLPKGCNIHSTGCNFKYAFTDELLSKSINEISRYLLGDRMANGLGFADVCKSLPEYIKNNIEKLKTVSKPLSKLKNNEGRFIGVDSVVEDILSGYDYLIEGPRGSGKTQVLYYVYKKLLEKLNNSLNNGSEIVCVPIYLKMDKLWRISALTFNALQIICSEFNVPYSKDRNVKYILLIDGNLGSTRGYMPSIVNELVKEESGVFCRILTHCHHVFLPNTYRKLIVQLLSYSDVVEYVLKELNNTGDVSRFFYELLRRAFENSGFPSDNKDDYFKTIKRIYNIFKNDNSVEKGGSFRSNVDGFYDSNLARTTQKGRLPRKLNEDEICIWKKLINTNEVFSAIRTPYYLHWLTTLFKSKVFYVFPNRLRTLQVMICRSMLQSMNMDAGLQQKIVSEYLYPLAVHIKNNCDGKNFTNKDEFKKQVNNTSFEQVTDELINLGFLMQMGNDLSFAQEFIYRYFLHYTGDKSNINLETNLRVCNITELATSFLDYIKTEEPFNDIGHDSVELAARIVLNERENFSLSGAEIEEFKRIVSDRLSKCIDIKQKASISTGIGLLVEAIDLDMINLNIFELDNRQLWGELSDDRLLSRYLITFYHYKQFVDQGYTNEKYWDFGTSTLLMNNGSKRREPLPVEDSDVKVFSVSNHPIVGVTWYEAKAYCNWLTQKLPDGYVATLPKIADVKQLLHEEIKSNRQFNGLNSCPFNSTTPVGIFASSGDVFLDLLGNVWEWAEDGYEFYGDYIQSCYGGAWGKVVDEDHLYTSYPAKLSSNNLGFRVLIKKENK